MTIPENVSRYCAVTLDWTSCWFHLKCRNCWYSVYTRLYTLTHYAIIIQIIHIILYICRRIFIIWSASARFLRTLRLCVSNLRYEPCWFFVFGWRAMFWNPLTYDGCESKKYSFRKYVHFQLKCLILGSRLEPEDALCVCVCVCRASKGWPILFALGVLAIQIRFLCITLYLIFCAVTERRLRQVLGQNRFGARRALNRKICFDLLLCKIFKE